jgi:hypothetical protein
MYGRTGQSSAHIVDGIGLIVYVTILQLKQLSAGVRPSRCLSTPRPHLRE